MSESWLSDEDMGMVVNERGIGELQAALQAGELTAQQLVAAYLERIAALNRAGPELHAVIETNPEAMAIAAALDAERAAGGMRGPLHGIPILLKDNIDTDDRNETTAGSLALLGTRPARDATVAARLRAAGAILLGKANLSEWANFRSTRSCSGWSARGGQTRNPYVLDRNPCGSSSGSAVAVAASLCAGALGTETDGSIICPSALCGVVGIKPTLGLTSRAGVIPIAASQDVVGPHARSVADAALLLSIIAGPDERDPVTVGSAGHMLDYTSCLDPLGLRGARIGVARKRLTGYSPAADTIFEQALALMRTQGAVIVDPADIPTIDALQEQRQNELKVMLYEFKDGINRYLAGRIANPRHPEHPTLRTLSELIAFNEEHAAEELPYFGQELFYLAEACGPLSDLAYREALESNRRLAGAEGISAALDSYELDALVVPSCSPAWPIDLVNGDHILGYSSPPAAMAGYPVVTVNAGYVRQLPVGISFIGRTFSEGLLIRLAYAFEQAAPPRQPPRFLATLGS